jgi:DNA-binding transcriptional LysR family regulator
LAKIADWDDYVGRRLRLRDLRVFFAVVQAGSLSKAAEHLHVSHPAVSQVISDLEHTIGIKLFDRSSRGVEPTIYARALLARGRNAFDELKQGLKDIEFLTDPASGELTIGYSQSIADTLLPQIMDIFSDKHPRVVVHADIVPTPTLRFPGLRDRSYDLILTRIPSPIPNDEMVADLDLEVLFRDPWVIVARKDRRWARRNKIALTELVDHVWLLPPHGSASHAVIAQAFKAQGLRMPAAIMMTHSMDLRAKLSSRGRFVTAVPQSVLRYGDDRDALQELPVDVSLPLWPVAVLTLKNRCLSPVVGRFIDCAREVAKAKVKTKSLKLG